MSADAEKIARECANEIMQMNSKICIFPRSRSEAIIARHIAAAIREDRSEQEKRIAELEAENSCVREANMRWSKKCQNIFDDLTSERQRREEAEAVLRGVRVMSHPIAIDADTYFRKYEPGK